MGVDYYAYTVIGLKVSGERIMEDVSTKPYNGCICKPQRNHKSGEKFCPICGQANNRPYQRRKIQDRFSFTEDELLGGGKSCATIEGYQVWANRDMTEFYVAIVPSMGHLSVRDDVDIKAPFPEFSQDEIEKFCTTMQKYRLYNSSLFGVWTIVHMS